MSIIYPYFVRYIVVIHISISNAKYYVYGGIFTLNIRYNFMPNINLTSITFRYILLQRKCYKNVNIWGTFMYFFCRFYHFFY